MCYRPVLVHTLHGDQVCGCGQCLECKKIRTNDVAHRLYRAGKEVPHVHFWTLTYRNENLPLLVRPTKDYLIEKKLLSVVDIEQDWCPRYIDPLLRVFDHSPKPYLEVVDRPDGLGQDLIEHPVFKHREIRLTDYIPSPFALGQLFELNGEFLDSDAIDNMHRRRFRKLYFKDYDDNKNRPVFVDGFSICPSLRSRDVQLWIKHFKGCDGHKNSYKFKYYYCGEYGPQTDRPHFHMVTYGLTDFQVARMAAEWRKMFGNCSTSRVVRIDENGQDHLFRSARYVGKYVSKGKYESPLVTEGYAQRPHGCSSTNLSHITPEEFDYYTGADLFKDAVKDYIVSDAFKQLSPYIQEQQLLHGVHRYLPSNYYTDDIIKQIKDRLYYSIPNTNEKYRYSLGRSFKNKLFKTIDYERIEQKKRYFSISGKYRLCEKDDDGLSRYSSAEKETYYVMAPYYAARIKRIVSTPLQTAITDFTRNCHLEDVSGKFRQIIEETENENIDYLVKQVKEIYEADFKARESLSEKNYRKSLQKFLF